jgi:hypothetical protein
VNFVFLSLASITTMKCEIINCIYALNLENFQADEKLCKIIFTVNSTLTKTNFSSPQKIYIFRFETIIEQIINCYLIGTEMKISSKYFSRAFGRVWIDTKWE